MKRRALVIPLVGIMLAALAVPALAEETQAKLTQPAVPEKIQVLGGSVIDTGSSGGTVYSVDIEWGSMVFEYVYKKGETWNPETHEYSTGTTSVGWQPAANKNSSGLDSNVIKVTNHSNIGVTCSFLFEGVPWFANEFEPKATFSPEKITLASGETTSRENADTQTTSLSISSKPIEINRTQDVLGTISVTIE